MGEGVESVYGLQPEVNCSTDPITTTAQPVRVLVSRIEVFSDKGARFYSYIWKEGIEYYFAMADVHIRHDLNSLRGTHLPWECIYAKLPTDLQLANTEYLRSSGVYIKRIPIVICSDNIDVRSVRPINADLIAEARFYQFLNTVPQGWHPNICKYYGVVANNGYIDGLALERCNTTLMDLAKSGTRFDDALINKISGELRSALEFIHSLGYAHNDVNPANVGLDSKYNVKLLDFDACPPIGQTLTGKNGTPGWGDYVKSSVANDMDALKNIKLWMKGQYDPMDHIGF